MGYVQGLMTYWYFDYIITEGSGAISRGLEFVFPQFFLHRTSPLIDQLNGTINLPYALLGHLLLGSRTLFLVLIPYIFEQLSEEAP